MKKVLLLVILYGLLIACDGGGKKGPNDEGIISYEIIYLRNEVQKVSQSFLPKKMELVFNDNYAMNNIEGFMGTVIIRNILDFKGKRAITMVKFLENKYVFVGKKNEEPCCFELMKPPTIKLSKDTINISGQKCLKAEITLKETGQTYDVLYTNDIKIRNINKNTAYEKIDGVLMDFRMDLSKLNMRFKATEISFEPVSDEEFQVPEDYRNVSRDKMVEIINRLLE